MDAFFSHRLKNALGAEYQALPFQVLPQVDSTNLQVKLRARSGQIAAPYLLIADTQTAGRGRLGRTFVSPPETGLYMSLLLRPPVFSQMEKITILAAVAVCRAIEELTALRPKIKWVNDLFLRGRKVCGILAEGVGDQAVVGIGVNLRTPPGGFPPEAGVAGALDIPVDRARLAGRIAAHMLEGLSSLSDSALMDAYRSRMPLIGREISYQQEGQTKNARVTGVDDEGGLMIRDAEGDKILRCGEISLGSHSFLGLE